MVFLATAVNFVENAGGGTRHTEFYAEQYKTLLFTFRLPLSPKVERFFLFLKNNTRRSTFIRYPLVRISYQASAILLTFKAAVNSARLTGRIVPSQGESANISDFFTPISVLSPGPKSK